MTDQIKELIAQDKIDKALTLLQDSNAPLEETQTILLKNRWKELNNKYLLGTLTDGEYAARRTKFLEGLLWLMDPESFNIGKIIEELEDLRSENNALTKEVAFYKDKEDNYSGYKFQALYEIFEQQKIDLNAEEAPSFDFWVEFPNGDKEMKAKKYDSAKLTLNQLVFIIRRDIDGHREFKKKITQYLFSELYDRGILDSENRTPFFTTAGKKYLIELIRKNYNKQ